MKLESVIARLEQIRISVENNEYEDFSEGYVYMLIIQVLLDFIGNLKVEGKVNEIAF